MRNSSKNPSLNWLIETYGVMRTFEVCMRLGGSPYYMPQKPGNRSLANRGRISTFFSDEELTPLCERFGGQNITFPLAHRFCVQVLYWVKGLSVAETGRTMHRSVRDLARIIGKRPPDCLTSIALATDETRRLGRRTPMSTNREIFQQLGLSTHDVEKYGEAAL